MANRLSKETSPYLRQHQDNPVDWYPWSEEALARARSENKPILLSIGYSACHWCHVMEEESFENPAIAELMNRNFISIKVDREERPDLDQIYQNVAQALTRSGGWPLTVFLTPDLKPYFGGTYFPPEDRYGRPGFPRVLEALSQAYREDRESVAENARRLTEFIGAVEGARAVTNPEAISEAEALASLEEAADSILSQADWVHGGVGSAPKFPNAMLFSFLWRVNTGRAREAVLLTLQKMAEGGIYDQLGGGFHRYSVDEEWAVPHFEKMLYDNGILLKLYAEVVLSGGDGITERQRGLFTRVLRETVEYALRELRSPEGGFYAAQDADSEGEEGRYFVWDPQDLKKILGASEHELVMRHYGVTETGNFEHGKTVLHIADPDREPTVEERLILSSARAKLLAARTKRAAPATDHKVLTGWNALMISGLSWASLALRDAGSPEEADRAREAARGAFKLIRSTLSRPEGRLWATLQNGQPKLNAYLDDYAFSAMAALDLARASDESGEISECIAAAAAWMRVVREHFSDPKGGGYFFTSDDHEKLIHRPKTVFDQAIPSGTSVALECMAALAEISPDGAGADFEAELEKQLRGLFPLAVQAPQACGELLSAALLRFQGPIVVSGPRAWEGCRHANVFQKAPAQGMLLVCHRQACGLPLASTAALREEVAERLKLA